MSWGVEPVSGFEPLTVRLQGRFTYCGQLLRSRCEPVSSSPDYRSMSVVSAPFWHAAGTTSWNVGRRATRRAASRQPIQALTLPLLMDKPLTGVSALAR
jgi:hypothetical protein